MPILMFFLSALAVALWFILRPIDYAEAVFILALIAAIGLLAAL